MTEREREQDEGLTADLEALGRARGAVEPLPGFSSRVVAGARRQRIRRQRTRIAGLSLAGAAAAIAGALWVTRGGPSESPASLAGTGPAVVAPGSPDDGEQDPELTAVLEMTDVDMALAPRAEWDSYLEPVAAAGLLLEPAGDDESAAGAAEDQP